MYKIISISILLFLIFNINAIKFDVLHEFRLYDHGFDVDSNFIRLDDKFERNVETLNIFHKVKVEAFAFESIFRFDRSFNEVFHILSILDEDDKSQIFISADRQQGIFFTIYNSDDGKKYTANFNNTKVFDDTWHKIVVSFSRGTVKLWFDCELTKRVVNFPKFIPFNGIVFLHLAFNTTDLYNNFGDFDLLKMNLYSGSTRPLENVCQDTPNSYMIRFI